MGVVPYHGYERCLDRASVRRGSNGFTYFNIVACGPNAPHAVDKYRLKCNRDPNGPWPYEQKIDGVWVSATAQPFSEMDQFIARVCPRTGRPDKPPRPSF